MKKLIHIVLMIGLISACTKSSVQYEQTGEISFRPVAAKVTRSAVTPYYWPTEGSLMFAGYSPADAEAINFSYSWVNRTMTINTYKQSNDIAKTKDLMWFDVTERSYVDNSNRNSQGVEVTGCRWI